MDSSSLVIEQKEYLLLKRFINLSSYHKDKILLKNLARLSHDLEMAHIYPDIEMPNNVVRINSIVTLSSKYFDMKTFQLVLPAQDKLDHMNVSILTHLGAALIGQTEGSTITLEHLSSLKKVKITEVIQQNKNISLDMVL